MIVLMVLLMYQPYVYWVVLVLYSLLKGVTTLPTGVEIGVVEEGALCSDIGMSAREI